MTHFLPSCFLPLFLSRDAKEEPVPSVAEKQETSQSTQNGNHQPSTAATTSKSRFPFFGSSSSNANNASSSNNQNQNNNAGAAGANNQSTPTAGANSGAGGAGILKNSYDQDTLSRVGQRYDCWP